MMTMVPGRDDFLKSDEIKTIETCIQCGTCSGSCPLGDEMDLGPRALIALIRDGDMHTAVSSATPWLCVSCYQCMSRCPQNIPVADIMYRIKQIAVKNNTVPTSGKLYDLYKAFEKEIAVNGRISESHLMARYGLKQPMDTISNTLTAFKLLKRKRIDLVPEKTREPAKLSELIENCQQGVRSK